MCVVRFRNVLTVARRTLSYRVIWVNEKKAYLYSFYSTLFTSFVCALNEDVGILSQS